MNESPSIKVPEDVEQNVKFPTFYLLNPAERLYRFGSSDNCPYGYQASRWWVRQREFDLLSARASRGKMGLGLQARFDMSVLQSWGNRMDVLITAILRKPVDAWMGCPRVKREIAPNGVRITMP